MKFDRALYGDVNGAHDLVATTSADSQFARRLAARTDRPPAQSPGDELLPFSRGFTFESAYVFTLTRADPTASRSGMVKTTAIFGSIQEVTRYEDISFVFDRLRSSGIESGLATVENTGVESETGWPSDPRIRHLAALLLDPDVKRPVVWVGSAGFERAISVIWRGLWQAARASFSFGFAFTPHDVNAISPPTIVMVPENKSTRWGPYVMPTTPTTPTLDDAELPRSSRVLLSIGDAALTRDRIAELQPITGQIVDLDQLIRLTDLLDLETMTPNEARVKVRLATRFLDSTIDRRLLTRALDDLIRSIKEATINDILALRNLQFDRAGALKALSTELHSWMAGKFLGYAARDRSQALDVVRFLERGREGPVADGISAGLTEVLATADWTATSAALIGTLVSTDGDVARAVIARLPDRTEIQNSLASAIAPAVSADVVDVIIESALKRGFGLLAAAVLWHRNPEASLREFLDLAFVGNARNEGASYIARHIAGTPLVTTLLRAGDANVLEALAGAAECTPQLFQHFDPKVEGWRILWRLARAKATAPWAEMRMPPHDIADAIYDLTLAGAIGADDSNAFWSSLIRTRCASILDRPRRAEFWGMLDDVARDGVLEDNAREWWARALSGVVAPDDIEAPLRQALAREAVRRSEKDALVPPTSVQARIEELIPELSESVKAHWRERSFSEMAAPLSAFFAWLGLPVTGSKQGKNIDQPYRLADMQLRSDSVALRSNTAPSVSALVITALQKELDAVRAYLSDVEEKNHPLGDVYWVGSNPGGASTVAVAVVGMGNERAALLTERALQFFAPRLALFVGVAGGLKDVSLGDVVVAEKIYNYEFGKASGTFETRPDVTRADFAIIQQARAEITSGDWLKRLSRDAPNRVLPRAFIGALASGSAVVASLQSAQHELIKNRYGDSLAVDMEGAGFLETCYSHRNVAAVVIRGVSDLVEGKSAADAIGSQERAATNAAAFAFALLRRLK